MKKRNAVRMMSDNLDNVRSRAALIVTDTSMTEDERKIMLNRLRRDVIHVFGFYSAERESLDGFIESELTRSQGQSQSARAAV